MVAQMTLWARRGFSGNVAVAGAAIGIAHWLVRKVDAKSPGLCAPRQVIIWAVAWVLLAHSLNLVSWTAARLNLVPAFGMSLLLAVVISRIRPASALPVLAVSRQDCFPRRAAISGKNQGYSIASWQTFWPTIRRNGAIKKSFGLTLAPCAVGSNKVCSKIFRRIQQPGHIMETQVYCGGLPLRR